MESNLACQGLTREWLQVLPRKRQTLLFTATWTQPVEALRGAALADPCVFRAYDGLRTADNLTERYLLVPAKVKEVYLVHVLRQALLGGGGDGDAAGAARSALVFCGKRAACELVSGLLYQLGIAAVALHSGKPQKARLAALHQARPPHKHQQGVSPTRRPLSLMHTPCAFACNNRLGCVVECAAWCLQFKSRAAAIMVATDVAARGLDIPSVDLVINFDVPVNASEYTHRVGRTARAGRGGEALTFVSQYDVALVQAIEAGIGHTLGKCDVDEAAAVADITRMFAARRAAVLAIEGRASALRDRKR